MGGGIGSGIPVGAMGSSGASVVEWGRVALGDFMSRSVSRVEIGILVV
jgi:hypothetical protein